MWTAVKISEEKKNGMVYATVRFDSDTPGEAPITQVGFGDNFDATALNNWAYVKLQSLNASDAAHASLKGVPNGPLVPTKPPAPAAPV